ncbi:DNA glycosylase, partial [Fragilariopsis cylindrus CCMP1102]
MSTPIIPTTIKSNNELQLQSEVQEPPENDVNSLLLFHTWIDHSHADYHDFTEKDAIEIRSALLEWYNKNRRKLPWRDQEDQEEQEEEEVDIGEAIPITAYGVWVSEIMCQQTRVEAVIPYWIKWMKSFPTVYELAAATEDEVNAHWAGLGFYRRARYLHQGAKYVVKELDGKLPTTPQGLSKIQGIGPYTAAAIASIAFDVCVPVVDGNVCRVLSRLRGIANHIKHPILKDKLGWKLAGQIVEAGDGSSPGMVNQALMELGATYCAP